MPSLGTQSPRAPTCPRPVSCHIRGSPSAGPPPPVPMVCVAHHCPCCRAHSFRRESGLAGASARISERGIQMGTEHRPALPPPPPPGACPLGTPHSQPFLSRGKFGAVCTCTERATGLKLAAKVIKKQTPKDKVVRAGCAGGEGGLGLGASHLPLPLSLHQGPGVQTNLY